MATKNITKIPVKSQSRRNSGKEIGWKPMPLGYKIIYVLLALGFVSTISNFGKSVMTPGLFFGIIVNPPISYFVHALPLVLQLIVLYSIYQRVNWRLILGVFIFNLVNGVVISISMINMPMKDLANLLEKDISTMSPETLSSLNYFLDGVFYVVIGFTVIVTLIYIIYTYKKKDYFFD